jgi:hypothetical protein
MPVLLCRCYSYLHHTNPALRRQQHQRSPLPVPVSKCSPENSPPVAEQLPTLSTFDMIDVVSVAGWLSSRIAHRLVASTPVTYSYRPTPAAAGQGRADESVCPCRQGRPAPVACGQERCSIGMARRVTGGRANYHSIVPAKRDLPSPLSPRPILPRKTLIACRPPATSIPIRIRIPLCLAW